MNTPTDIEFELADNGPASYTFLGGRTWIKGRRYKTSEPDLIRFIFGKIGMFVVRGEVTEKDLPKVSSLDPVSVSEKAARASRAGASEAASPSNVVTSEVPQLEDDETDESEPVKVTRTPVPVPSPVGEGSDVPVYSMELTRRELLQIAESFSIVVPGHHPSKVEIIASLDDHFARR